MKKAFVAVLVCLCLLLPGAWAEGAQPVLRSNVKVIGFQAGTYLKTNWQLQPERNPDVYTLPEYRTEREVRFTCFPCTMNGTAHSGRCPCS